MKGVRVRLLLTHGAIMVADSRHAHHVRGGQDLQGSEMASPNQHC